MPEFPNSVPGSVNDCDTTRSLREFEWRDVPALFADSAAKWSEHNVPRLGAALAFYTLMSIAPLLVVVAAIGSLAFGSAIARNEIMRQVSVVAGPIGARVVSFVLNGDQSAVQGVIAIAIGIPILFIDATAVLIELREALNTIWDLPIAKKTLRQAALSIVRERLFASFLVLCIGFLLLLSLAVNVSMSAFVHRVLPGSSLISFLVVAGLFAVIFRFIPDLKLQWVEVLAGALVTSLLFDLGNLIVAFQLASTTFGAVYGTAASVMALLIWLYYSSQIFFFGAAFTKVFSQRLRSRS